MEKEAIRTFRSCRKYALIVSVLGLACSYYSILVSDAKTADPSYVALCDISKAISCSNVLTSFYSKGFGILGYIFGETSPIYQSNGFYGLIFYAATAAFSLYPAQLFAKIYLVLTISSLIISAYLGYILFYVLEDLCVVCISTYLFNCALFILSIRNFRAIQRLKQAEAMPDYSSYLDGKTVKKRV